MPSNLICRIVQLTLVAVPIANEIPTFMTKGILWFENFIDTVIKTTKLHAIKVIDTGLN